MAFPTTLDTSTNFLPTSKSTTLPRVLLLSPPSLSSHPEKLNSILEAHDRHATDIQMLDRLSLSLVQLPPSTYSTILILADADNTRTESKKLLTRKVLSCLVTALKPGGILRSQDGTFASEVETAERQDAILAGLIVSADGVTKPEYDTTATVPLRFGKNKPVEKAATNGNGLNGGPTTTNGSALGGISSTTSPAGTGVVSLNLNGKRANGPAGVGFVDFSDDFDAPVEAEDSDDELIDENTLLDESDLMRPIIQRMLFPVPVPPSDTFPSSTSPRPMSQTLRPANLPSQPLNSAPPHASVALPAKTAPAG